MDNKEFVRIPLFNGSNYPAWKYRMLVVLEEHELTRCIDREIVEVEELQIVAGATAAVVAETERKIEARRKQDRRCKSLLISCIHDSQLEYVQDKQTPKEIWSALRNVFERRSIASRLHLKKKMLTLRHEGGSLQEHFLIFDKVVREYRSTGAMIEDLDVVCHLLLTLGPAYSTVVTALETMPEENLSLEFVKCRLLDEEIKRRSADVDLVGESAVFPGAETAMLLKKQGRNEKVCYYCRKPGHFRRYCRLLQQKRKEDKWQERRSARKAEKAIEKRSSVCFNVGNNRSRRSWFVDSGCSSHMANEESFFRNLDKSMNIDVVLANGLVRRLVGIGEGIVKCVDGDGF